MRLKKLLQKLLHTAASFYWKTVRPKTNGVRAILLDETGTKVLLVKHTYIDGWYLPGGKVEKNETIIEGLARELREELGIVLGGCTLFGVYENHAQGKRDTIIVLLCNGIAGTPTQTGEIEAVSYFSLTALPQDVSPGTKRRLEELVLAKNPAIGMW